MHNSVHFKVVLLFLITLIKMASCLQPTYAQFKVEPKPNPFAIDKKKTKYYSPLRYNRVEGLFPALGLKIKNNVDSPLTFFGDFGYGLKSKEVGFNLGLEFKSPSWQIFKIGGKYFEDTFTQDDWIISRLENTLAALFIRGDFRDFYKVQGFSIWTSKDFQEDVHFRLSFWSGEYEEMVKNTKWSLFGGDKKFRNNPAITAGTENKLRFEWIIDKLDNPMFPMEGWYLEGAFEKGGDFLGGDFDQSGIFVSGKVLKPTILNQRLVVSGRYGYRADSRAPQHLMDLGGISTLRGYNYKEFQNGNVLTLGTIQYYFNGDILQKLPFQFIPLYSSLGLVLFMEVGALWNSNGNSFLSSNVSDSPDWKSDAGFSLNVIGDFFRVDFAKRLDRSKDTWAITVRLLPKI